MGNVASIDHSETRLQTTDTSKAFCLWQKSYGFSKKLYHSKQTVQKIQIMPQHGGT